ncbi:CBL-interacting protein kinase 18 [Castilleja foliolosa]|uniref:non-specific serine/threonine protein kinase n=1 Tax=Castilleja foliolosa TaxID=1961234 RepID=A0ABD3EGH9_9LAMI
METKGNSILMQKYEVGRMLGQGTFAKVYYGRNLETGQSVAIKVIDKEKVVKVGLMNQTKREVSGMTMVKHDYIVHLEEVLATKTKIYFVMEYVKGGELFHKVSKGKLRVVTARRYFQQLIQAVDFCHSRGVYHRDLKPENLLVDENGNLKVSDFGLSALSESKRLDGLLHTTCGTPSYVAPEVISRIGYDGAKADIWSCGVILFLLLAGHLPFRDSNLMEMYRKILKGEYKCPNWIPSEARRLLSRILDPNPNSRITIDKIMDNQWFRKGLDSKAKSLDMGCADVDDSTHVAKPVNLNAFDIISLSTGFDLSGLFVNSDEKDEIRFTSAKSASCIASRIEEIAGILKLRVTKKEQGYMRLEGSSDEGRNGNLSMDVRIFEITPLFHLVEVEKRRGDSIDYQGLIREGMRPALKDIIWAWQGEQQHITC